MREQKKMATVKEESLQSYRMPNALIHSPRMVSFLAASTLDAILINEQLNPRKRGETKNKVRIKDLRWIVNLDSSHNTDILEKVLDELLTVSAKWNMFGDDPDFIDVKATNFLQDYSYRKRSKDGSLDIERGFINYRLTQTVIEIIDKKTKETELNIISAKIFEKPYTERLYQLGKSFLSDHDECEEERTVKEIKEFLGVFDKYESYKGFNYEVLKPALNEINKESDIEVQIIRTIRKNRKIHKIVFHVKEKRGFQMALPFSIETIPEIFRRTVAETEGVIRRKNIIKRLKFFRMSDANVKKVIERENNNINAIENQITQAEQQIEQGYKYRFGNRKFYHDFILYGWKYIEKETDKDIPPENHELIENLDLYGIKPTESKKLISEFGSEAVQNGLQSGIQQIIKKEEKGESIENKPGYIVGCINKGAGVKTKADKEAEAKKQKAAKERKAQEEAKKKADNLIASLLKEFESKQKEIIRKIFEALPEQEKDRELKIFERKIEGFPTGKIFANVENQHAIFDQKKSGLKFAEHSIITGTLRIHLLDRFKHGMTPEQAKFTIWAKTKGHEIEGGMSSGYRLIKKKTQNS